jgi:flagellar biosynthesis protein FliR
MTNRSDEIFQLVTRLPMFLPVYALVLFRVAGLMLAAPLLGSSLIPLRMRVGMCTVIALILYPAVAERSPVFLSLHDGLVGVAGETLIGLTMGLALTLVLVGTDLGGMLAGQQSGLALGQEFNPMTNSDSTVFGHTYFLVFQTVFMIAGGHRALVRALLDTFDTIPLASFRAGPELLDLLEQSLTGAFVLGLKLAVPVLIALFATGLALGFLSRTVPQLNVLTVGFGLKVMLAFAISALALPAAREVFLGSLTDSLAAIRATFGLPAVEF